MTRGIKANQVHSGFIKRLVTNLELESNASNPAYQIDILSGLVGSDDGEDNV
jgi:hypothetical protein